ncbi:hypothetical protein BDZ97DRAFT_1028862 [Flammula alnicola]|nr:hypothetical protein BDZ97DRAFT_1028862 [Flammula alnicola]
MADSVVFYVLVAGAIEHVKIDPRLNLAALLMDMKSPRYQPSPRLKRMEYRQCNFYLLKDPLKIDDENFPDIEPIIASLQDKTKCTQLTHTKHLKNIAKEFHHEHLYLVIEDTSNKAAQAVARLSQNHADLYQCLKVTVGVAKRWTRDYAESNGGIFVNNRTKPPEMKELETRLKDKRFFNVSHFSFQSISLKNLFLLVG